ncbi:MAG: bifunctional folylpolyglutamate synthase/dihydrofolate synthase [Synergistaceae bacterium]|nr:bifunctional folylpolyglutamate synthase/dihydrofolate synthase [Synergistaceae bacterium]
MMKRPFSTFEDLEDFFSRLASPGIRPGLERIARLLKQLGNPEKRFSAIHIVGTNGKGSTAAFTERILRESGYTTALYTSPHLESPAERLLFSGVPLSLEEWSACAFEVEDALNDDPTLREDPPTFFEIVTATAFLLCEHRDVDIAVVEAGLGGRLDATNLLGNICLTLITSISMDHMDFLGDTLESIAGEKFAVMRTRTPAVFSGTPAQLVPLFRSTANELGALPNTTAELCSCEEIRNESGRLSYVYRLLHPALLSSIGGEAKSFDQNAVIPVSTSLRGMYQIENSVLAISGILLLVSCFPKITSDTIRRGIAAARWPGRFETIDSTPPLVLDGGHNPGGVEKLTESLGAVYGGKKIGVVYGCMKDKAYPECLELLRKVCSSLYCVSVPENPRAAQPELLAETARSHGWKPEDISVLHDPLEAIRVASLSNEVVVCCGSLYLIGYVKSRLSFLKKERNE